MADWIAGAIKRPGGLHRSLGVAGDKKIPVAMIRQASKRKGRVGQQARLALTLRKMHRAG